MQMQQEINPSKRKVCYSLIYSNYSNTFIRIVQLIQEEKFLQLI